MRRSPTTDPAGSNYRENSGQEEHDRDKVGIILAVAFMVLTVIFQRAGLL